MFYATYYHQQKNDQTAMLHHSLLLRGNNKTSLVNFDGVREK